MAWWVWSSWVTENDGTQRPFYSFIIETMQPPEGVHREPVDLPTGATFHIAQRTVSDAMAQSVLQVLADRPCRIDLTSLLPDTPFIKADAYRTVCSAAFGHTSIEVDSAYNLSPVGMLLPSRPDLNTAITACMDRLGLPLDGDFASHLGGFDRFHAGPWLDGAHPIRVEFVRRRDGQSHHVLRLWRQAFKAHSHIVLLRATNDFETICEKAINVPADVEPYDIPLVECLDGYELRIFDAKDGSLKHREEQYFVREVRGNLALPTRIIQHNDALSKRANAHGAQSVDRAGSTVISHTTQFGTTFDPQGLRAHTQSIRAVLASELGEQTEDRWFPRAFSAQLDAISYLNQLLGPQVEEAVLVDPFFGEKALEEFLLRLGHAGLRLTVITSWGRTDPDTGARIPGGAGRAHDEAKRRLAPLLLRLTPYVAPALRLVNMVSSSGYQAFHDRYLLLYLNDGDYKVFLFSNSVNGLAANWPFCMSALTGRAKVEAKLYIEGLAKGYDCTKSTTPDITFEWPIPKNSPS